MSLYEQACARRRLAMEVLAEIEGLKNGHYVEQRALDAAEEEYKKRASRAEAQMEKVELDRDRLAREEAAEVRRRLLLFECKQLLESRQQDMLSDDAFNRLLADIDARLLECDSDEGDGGYRPQARIEAKRFGERRFWMRRMRAYL